MERCPHCGGRALGKVATRQYYCADCCCEVSERGDRLTIYRVDDEGELWPVDILSSTQPGERG